MNSGTPSHWSSISSWSTTTKLVVGGAVLGAVGGFFFYFWRKQQQALREREGMIHLLLPGFVEKRAENLSQSSEQTEAAAKRAKSAEDYYSYFSHLQDLSIYAILTNDLKKAEQLLEQQMKEIESLHGTQAHEDYLKSVLNMATFLSQTQRTEQALELYRKATKIEREELQESTPVLHATVSLASHYLQKEKFDDALSLLEEARDYSKDVEPSDLSSDEIHTQCNLYDALALLYIERQKHEDAHYVLTQSLMYHEVSSGKESLGVATIYAELSNVSEKLKRTSDSIKAQEKCLEIIFSLLDQSPPEAVPPDIIRYILMQGQRLVKLYKDADRKKDAAELEHLLAARFPNPPTQDDFFLQQGMTPDGHQGMGAMGGF